MNRLFIVFKGFFNLVKTVLLFLIPIFVIALIGIILLAIISSVSGSELNESQILSALVVTDYLIGAVVFILVLYLSYNILTFFYVQRSFMGESLQARIISLGIVTIVYFQSIWSIAIYPLLTLNNQFFEAFQVRTETKLKLPMDESSGFSSKIVESIQSFFDLEIQLIHFWLQALFGTVNTFLNGFPLKDVILGLLLLYSLGKIIDNKTLVFGSSQDDNKTYFNTIRGWLKTNGFNMLFALVFMLGAFLSIAAIIAIPWLKEDQDISEKISRNSLEESLSKEYDYFERDSVYSYGEFDFKENLDNLFNDLEKETATLQDSDAEFVIIFTNQFGDPLKTYINDAKRQNHVASLQWSNARNSVNALIKNEIETILKTYDIYQSNAIIGKERTDFFQNLTSYFKRFIAFHRGELVDFSRQLDDFKFFTKEDVDEGLSSLNSNRALALLTDYDLSETPLTRFFYSASVSPVYQTSKFYQNVPSLNSDLSSLGPFSFVAQWLIKTKSNEMVLITGMLGFGILGAGISSFIRERKPKTKDAVIVFKDNVTSTLISGVSAALVIFLSTKGGLAILTNNDDNLNTYSLLFLCFIGSVFSETIWIRAYSYLNKT